MEKANRFQDGHDDQQTEADLRDAERHKAEVYHVKGKENPLLPNQNYFSAMLDEDYLLVGNFVNQATRSKIATGEYIDFAKLMPRD